MNTPEFLEPNRTLPDIDLSEVSIPKRSSLMSLVPHGLGSGEVESLWSYMHRLAEAHSVRFTTFLLDYLGQFSHELFGRACRLGRRRGDWQDLVKALHGVTFGSRVSRLLERLTSQKGLEHLTLIPLNRTAGLNVFLRKTQAWCPACLAEDKDPYARLIWTIEGVTHCPRHGTPLETLCSACKKPQKFYARRSDILKCVCCGTVRFPSGSPVPPLEGHGDRFENWASKQTLNLICRASENGLETRHIDVRNHNLRLSTKIEGMAGVTGLSTRLGIGRTTVRSWIKHCGRAPLDSALRWAWVVDADVAVLFSRKLQPSELSFRLLPAEKAKRTRPQRRKPLATDSEALYLATLRLAAANPFRAPRIQDLKQSSGAHEKHQTFRDPHDLRLIRRLRKNERVFRMKERVWRIVTDVHSASIKASTIKKRLGQGSLRSFMNAPGAFSGPLARSYLRWLKRRYKAGDASVRAPKRVPVDVRAYWSLTEASKRPDAG